MLFIKEETYNQSIEINWSLRKDVKIPSLLDIDYKAVDSSEWISITKEINNSGNFTWNPDSNVVSGQYQIKLTGKNQYMERILYSELFWYKTSVEEETPLTEWVYDADLNYERHGLGMVEYQGKLYAVGGWSNNTALECFENGTWTELESLPVPQEGHAITIIGSKIYIMGSYHWMNITQIYDIETREWSEGPALPQGMYWTTIQAVENKIYVLGGYVASTIINNLYILDTETNEWTEGEPLPYPAYITTSCIIDNSIYILGGQGDKRYPYYLKYDVLQNKWSEIPLSPAGLLFGAQAISFENKIYLIGGNYAYIYEALSSVYIFDTETQQWTEGPFLNTGRYQFASAVLNNTIYICGGRDKNANSIKSMEKIRLK